MSKTILRHTLIKNIFDIFVDFLIFMTDPHPSLAKQVDFFYCCRFNETAGRTTEN